MDLPVTKHIDKLKFNIYRKPATTDVTIPVDSHHPFLQKMAAFNYFIHRLLTVPLDDEDFNDELNTIKYIAQANGYNSSLIDNLLRKQKHKLSKPRIEKDTKTIFISTTYTNIMPKILTSVLNNNNRTVIFKTNNNLMNIHHNKITIPLEKKTGVYKMCIRDRSTPVSQGEHIGSVYAWPLNSTY